MKIKWLGHSSFLLEESTGTKVITDPYNGKTVGYDMAKTYADIVTISHHHDDHDYLATVEGNPRVIDRTGGYELMGVHIMSIKSFHDDVRGAKRGENIIFKYRLDGVEVCHLGDIGEKCSIELSELIGAVDILLVPIGGKYTINAEQAKQYVDLLMPDVVMPMHYCTDKCKLDIDELEEFIDLFDEEQVVYCSENVLTFDRADFEHEDTKVYVMNNV